MSDIVITAHGLGKKYTIGHETRRERYTALRDVIASGASTMLRKARDIASGRPIIQGDVLEDVWALRDVGFEVKRGDVVGIIGRNGAGKSTLLKILSRITEPTKGRVSVTGRVASLLEVGTGFHPELTGRENVFLNAAILGMTRVEVRRKLDEIIAFAEVDKFIDTPVKRYSSGMYVRLAFSVAAHLQPDILIVDEVLAVGDVEFQKKCIGKMEAVSRELRTVLFVSHNMHAVQSLCSRCILLAEGGVQLDAGTQSCVQAYLNQHTGAGSFRRALQPAAKAGIQGGRIVVAGERDDARIDLRLQVWSDAERKVSLDLRLFESAGNPVGFGSLGTLDSRKLIHLFRGENTVYVSFPASGLANGSYAVSLDVTVPFREYLDRAERCLSFDLERASNGPNGRFASQQWGYGSMEIALTAASEATAVL